MMNTDAIHIRHPGATHACRIELLSEKLARHLTPLDWTQLFHGPELESIRFEQTVQTVLYAEAGELRIWSDHERDSFVADVEWLAVRHNGSVDHYLDRAVVVFFDEPGPCLRMAMGLQRSASHLHLRMGIHTGTCVVGAFRSGGEHRCSLIGPETGLAARVAATAATGSIAVSPATYALVKDDVHADSAGCLVMEEFNECDLAQVWLTPTPAQGGPDLSTFAGLGRL